MTITFNFLNFVEIKMFGIKGAYIYIYIYIMLCMGALWKWGKFKKELLGGINVSWKTYTVACEFIAWDLWSHNASITSMG
jgi:hypothetical protein